MNTIKKRTGSLTAKLAAALLAFAGVATAWATTVTTEAQLRTAIAAGGSVTLGADIALTQGEIAVANTVTLDLGTFTISSPTNVFRVAANGNFTVNADATNPGGISTATNRCCVYASYGWDPGAKTVVLNGGVFTGNCVFNWSETASQNIEVLYGFLPDGYGSGEKTVPTSVTINGGTFTGGYEDGNVGAYRCYYFTVNGGTFERGLDCADTVTGSFGVTTTCKAFFKGGKYRTRYPAKRTQDATPKVFIGTENVDYVYYIDGDYYVIAPDYSVCEATACYSGACVVEVGWFWHLVTGCYQAWQTTDSSYRWYFLTYAQASSQGTDAQYVNGSAANGEETPGLTSGTPRLLSAAKSSARLLSAASSSFPVDSALPTATTDNSATLAEQNSFSIYYSVNFGGVEGSTLESLTNPDSSAIANIQYFRDRTDINACRILSYNSHGGSGSTYSWADLQGKFKGKVDVYTEAEKAFIIATAAAAVDDNFSKAAPSNSTVENAVRGVASGSFTVRYVGQLLNMYLDGCKTYGSSSGGTPDAYNDWTTDVVVWFDRDVASDTVDVFLGIANANGGAVVKSVVSGNGDAALTANTKYVLSGLNRLPWSSFTSSYPELLLAVKNRSSANVGTTATIALRHRKDGEEDVIRAQFTCTFSAESVVNQTANVMFDDAIWTELKVNAGDDSKIQEVYGSKTYTDENGNSLVYADVSSFVGGWLSAGIKNNTAVGSGALNIETGLDSVTLAEDSNAGATIKKYVSILFDGLQIVAPASESRSLGAITYGVVPKARIMTTGETASDTTRDITNAEIGGETIKFRLPLTDDYTARALVVHTSDDATTYPEERWIANVAGSAGARYVEISTTHFSEFVVSPIGDDDIVYVTSASGAFIGGYTTIADAYAATGDGGTIYLLQNVSENIEVSSAKTFNINANGYAYSGAVTAASGLVLSATTSGTTTTYAAALAVAQIGTTKYTSLAAAFAAVQDGETIQLIADVTDATMGAKGIVASGAKTVTLDLAGFNATCTDGSAASNRMIKIAEGLTLNVVNMAETQSVMSVLGDKEPVGVTPATLPYGVFRAEVGTTLNIDGGEGNNIKLVNGQAWGLNVKLCGARATLSNIEIESTYGGGIEVTEADLGTSSQPGYAELTDCTFTQTGYYDHCSTALSVSGGSELVVNSGTYTSENYGLYVFSSGGRIVVNGGTFAGTGKAVVKAEMDTNTYPAYTGAVQISGGRFTGALSVTSPASMSISGGVFTVPVADGYCAEGCEPADNTDAETKVAYPYTVNKYVAQNVQTSEKYFILAAALDAAQDGQTVKLLADEAQNDGIIFDKAGSGVILDLDGKTFTVNTGANCNNRAFRIDNGTLTVKNGSIVAAGSGTTSSNGAGCYGAFRVEKGGTLNVQDATLSNSRPWGLNVKICGGRANLERVTINSSYGGGIEVTEANLGASSQTGYAELTDCTFTQTGYFDHCSTALSVSGGSELVVNSGTYTSENYGLYVFSSGGKITVKGGTITGENKAAVKAAMDTNTYPAYTGAVQISGGRFKGALDVTSPASMSISGGVFSSEILANYCAEGYEPAGNTDAETMAAYPYTVGLLPAVTAAATGTAEMSKALDGYTFEIAVAQNGAAATVSQVASPVIPAADLPASGKYATYAFTAVRTSDGRESAVKNKVGILRVADAAAGETTVIAVPWLAFGEKITIDSLVYLGNRSEGDQLTAYDASRNLYYTWTLAKNAGTGALEWTAGTTVKTGSEVVEAPAASEFEVARGQGVFLKRTDKTAPIYLVGRAAEDGETVAAAVTTLAAGSAKAPVWTLVAAPSTTDLDLNASASPFGSANKSDTIVLVTSGAGLKIPCTYANGKWGRPDTKKIEINGTEYFYTERSTENCKIPAGTGFWYLNKGGAKTVRW